MCIRDRLVIMEDLLTEGYKILNGIYNEAEINDILRLIEEKEMEKQFGLREFLKQNKDLEHV